MGRRNRRFRRMFGSGSYEKAQKITELLEKDKTSSDTKDVAITLDSSKKLPNDGIIRDPVEIYVDGKWAIVDKSSRDFPVPVKMKITPTWALEVCTERNRNNRNIRQDRVIKYIRDIMAGNWEVINNGIGFYSDGQLADGQHRLWAIVESEKTVEMVVLFGMEKKAIIAIDEGASRSTRDVALIKGVDATNAQISVSNYILEYKGLKSTSSRNEQIAFFEQHRESITFVCERLKRKGVAKAPVLAAAMRAWYNIDRDKLARFLEILENGVMNNSEEQAAIPLREFLMKNNNNSGPFRAEAYRKTESAIVNFIEGRSIERLYGMKEEQFLLPEERIASTASQVAATA